MTDGCHLKNMKDSHISATVRPIGTKFGTVTHIGAPNRTGSYNFEHLKIEDGGRRHLKK